MGITDVSGEVAFPEPRDVMRAIPAGRYGYVEATRIISHGVTGTTVYTALTALAMERRSLVPPLPEDVGDLVLRIVNVFSPSELEADLDKRVTANKVLHAALDHGRTAS